MCCICMVLCKRIFQTKDGEKYSNGEYVYCCILFGKSDNFYYDVFVHICKILWFYLPSSPFPKSPLFCNAPLLLLCVSSFIFLLHFTHVRENRQRFSLCFWVFSSHPLSEVESNHVTENLSNTPWLLGIVLFYLLYPQSVIPGLTGLWALAQHPEYL